MSVSEQEFSNALRIAFSAARDIDAVISRQPAGKIRTDRNTWVECAPVGASDLAGTLGPEGYSLQIEIKGARTRETEAQVRWRERHLALGAIALTIRYVEELSLAANVARGVTALRVAIADRRTRG